MQVFLSALLGYSVKALTFLLVTRVSRVVFWFVSNGFVLLVGLKFSTPILRKLINGLGFGDFITQAFSFLPPEFYALLAPIDLITPLTLLLAGFANSAFIAHFLRKVA